MSFRTDVFALNSYGYSLPDDLIAQYPAAKRDHARLLVLNRQTQTITHTTFAHLAQFLPSKSTIVLNNSKVIPARLLGTRKLRGDDPKATGEVEVFLLKALDDGYSFEALLRPLKRIKEGEPMEFAPGITAVLTNREKRIVTFNKKNVLDALKNVGHIPLPPYIKRSDEPLDRREYQTVYAKQLGSVASPTAGLHFTRPLLSKLRLKGHSLKELTLHINYGTFKPVEEQDIRNHPMHTEGYSIASATYASIVKAKKTGRPVVAVGTTSCRVLESVANTGVLNGETNMFIYPGYSFKLVDALITNFHLPYSTLLMLVTAFGGYDFVMRAYREAIKQKYRFYSYGDAMLIV
jgi:S-adenosylmethionine:tRNA ribosyltransferase-isomerase